MNIKKRLHIFLLGLILLLGLFLRQHNLDTWPRKGATFDEYAWTWLGISLIQQHYPVSWSAHQHYEQREEIRYQDARFVLVKPFLEHPPFFGLVAGGFALANGVDDMFEVDIPNIRGLALILGGMSIVMVYVLSSTLYDKKTGLLAAALYAVVPTIAVGSRLVQNENFFIPFFLLALFFVLKYIQRNRSVYRNSAAIVCGLLSLAKVPWLAAALAIVLMFLFLRRYKDIAKFLAIVITIFSLFIIYGLSLDADLFIKLWGLQLNRYDITFDGVFALFTHPYLVDRFMLDGWIYVGWFSFVILLTKDIKKHTPVIFGLLAYFALFVFAIPNEPGHGWYRYPFYPFLIISIAVFLREYFNKNFLLTFFSLLFVGLSLLQLTWASTFGFSFVIFRLTLFLYGVGMLPVFFKHKKVVKVAEIANYGSLMVLFLLSTWAILLYNEQ